ncbi:MAG: hypothetical protein M3014_05525, partial [Chloroflexota bacterium]|nr:hypothetical protein [Chloroflexota bacterium]
MGIILLTAARPAWAGPPIHDLAGSSRAVQPAALLDCWQIVPSPNPSTSTAELNGVAVVSTTDVWSVGTYQDSNAVYRTLVEHWNGSAWSVVPSPNVGTQGSYLNGVATVSANDVWAVGEYENGTLIEHWNGSAWSVVPSPNPGPGTNGRLIGVAAVSANDVWAVGSYYGGSGGADLSFIEHWNGGAWSLVSNPNPGTQENALDGVA